MKRSEVIAAQTRVRRRLEDAGIALATDIPIEVADFGLDHWEHEGLGIVVRVNTAEYCSKYLTLEAGQACPIHHHKFKKETFFALHGEVWLKLEGKDITLSPGQQVTLSPGVNHTFGSHSGAVVEEVSTHDENSDSYFANADIIRDPIIEED